jgi:hypothetical protein
MEDDQNIRLIFDQDNRRISGGLIGHTNAPPQELQVFNWRLPLILSYSALAGNRARLNTAAWPKFISGCRWQSAVGSHQQNCQLPAWPPPVYTGVY